MSEQVLIYGVIPTKFHFNWLYDIHILVSDTLMTLRKKEPLLDRFKYCSLSSSVMGPRNNETMKGSELAWAPVSDQVGSGPKWVLLPAASRSVPRQFSALQSIDGVGCRV